jgi:DNA-binding transcriptional regulator YiaG
MITPKEFAAKRKALGFTQATLAKLCGVKVLAVSRWETGYRPVNQMAALILELIAELIETRNKGNTGETTSGK